MENVGIEKKQGQCHGMNTSHRCMQRVFSGGFFINNDTSYRICGRPFCLLCGNKRGLRENYFRCDIHQEIGEE